MVSAGRDEQRARVPPHRDRESEDPAVEVLGLIQVGDLEVHVSDPSSEGGQPLGSALGSDANDRDPLIGRMNTAALAEEAVRCHNTTLRRVQAALSPKPASEPAVPMRPDRVSVWDVTAVEMVLRDRFSLAFGERSDRDECYREAARLICGCVVGEFAAHRILGSAD